MSWSNTGKTKLAVAVGLSYSFARKFSVRTGFYTALKVYSAEPYEYNPPANFWNYYPNLDKVDANCRVYEIPLILGYTFSETAKNKWFTSAGLSSVIMKRETYDYYYKNQAGQNVKRSYTFNNENKHFFSSLRLSAGLQRNISNRISFTAEPYVNIPVSGIGYGKVKLNSAGILLSIAVKPFSRSK